ncbi:MAG TPA: Holliday junction resolvase RuvX [Nitrospira sp.]|nr:Holliday junction resolvase RuvX [Nitrospira sp.]MBX7038715.1 Holliday junction resolvase RuvX [Nitrospira sp.]MCW5793449.1 Holliday junction resolvase RuvX [Nitrospira sp.]HMW86658.1 Holliday junction resolvase RuvX [Nitrospira sp.]HMX90486.1 Holliday junction resolvase RuvX [Nitrospira sp.]
MKGQRILAIDHGSKRIGFALSDELGWTAQPLETFHRRNPEADIRHIQELVREHEVGRVLVGLPLRLDGESGPAAKVVEEFIQLLEPALSVPVVTWDERMTTCAAEDLLIAADVGRRKRKGIVDRIAAAILLQSYLASLEKPSTSQEQAISNSHEDDPWSFDEPRVDDAEAIDCGTGSSDGDTLGPLGLSGPALGSKSRRQRAS